MNIGVSLPVREMKNDLGAIRAYAQQAEELGLTHLRVPDMVIRRDGGHLHEPMMLLAWVAAFTEKIQLCPSVIVLPVRQTAHFAKQVAELDVLSNGRVRLGIGVGANREQYEALGQDFGTRGARCDEQLELLEALLTQKTVSFEGRWDRIVGMGIDPLPVQRHIPVWYGGASIPGDRVVRRIGRLADGWFVLCSPEEYPEVKARIDASASDAGRAPAEIQTEAGVAVVGPRESEWQQRVANWRDMGIDFVCLRTLGGGLTPQQHLEKLAEVVPEAAGLVS